jgi:predicted oxidoreductase
MDADVTVVGAGLAGLAATAELARAGRRVLLLDQEPESNLGGQAFWSFGGLFLVGTPQQRRMGIKDSRELAWQDCQGSAFFDRPVDDPAGEDYLTGKDIKLTLSRIRPGAPAPVEAFKRHGADFVVARTLPELVEGMNKLTPEPLLQLADLDRQIIARDREIDIPFTKDLQVMAIRNARRSRGERLARTAAPHKILDPKAGPLIAVRLNILTRKTLGGLQTDLSGRVLGLGRGALPGQGPSPVPGLFAAGEVAGFGGGGMHGYRSLEGSFLGGCLFSGRQAGRAAARETGA